MESVRIQFYKGQSLAQRREQFREALLKFGPKPDVFLLRDGYLPLHIRDSGDLDAMFAEALLIVGEKL